MATTTVQASGVGTPDGWDLAAGASKTVAVNSPDDDASSYIRAGDPVAQQTFTCTPAGLVSGDTVTSVAVYARCRHTVNPCNFRLGYAFTPSGGGSQSAESGTLVTSGSFANFSFVDSGLSVVWGSGLTFWIRNTQPRLIHCTTLYVVITYTAAAGGGTKRLTLPVRVSTLVGGQLAA